MHPGVNILYFHEVGNAFSLGKMGWLAITNIILQEKMKMVRILGDGIYRQGHLWKRAQFSVTPLFPQGKRLLFPLC